VLGPERATIGPAYAAELRRAPVAVVWPLADDLPCRVFEAAACGRRVLTAAGFDLHALQCRGVMQMGAGTDLDAWVRVAGDMIEDAEENEDAARSAVEWVKPHSWDARLAQLIEGRVRP
jgi:hypothetical protein